jgi:hypothetical protein
MRCLAIAVCLSGCVDRVDATRVTLRAPSDLAIEGSGSAAVPPDQLAGSDLLLSGRPADVLAFDGDELRMHLTRDEVRSCHHGRRCDPRVLDLRVDTPLANVASVAAVGVAGRHGVIPLGLVVSGLLIGFGGGTVAYERAEHEHVELAPAPIVLAAGLALLAAEIHARLARDTVTVVWSAGQPPQLH